MTVKVNNAHNYWIRGFFRSVIPRSLRSSLVKMDQRLTFRKTWPLFAEGLLKGNTISDILLKDLVYGWGNVGFSAHISYLRAIIEHMNRTEGPVLECGSGLSTLVIGILAKRNGIQVYSLEHDEAWVRRIQNRLNELNITDVQLIHSSLVSYGHYSWYDYKGLDLPNDISLIICDGPPAHISGGRFGLLPEMYEYCEQGCIILLDDYMREDERRIVYQWSMDYRLEVLEKGTGDKYAEIKVFRD